MASKKKSFWDVFIISEEGEWRGLRAPKNSLQRVLTFLSVIVFLFSLTLAGWLFSSWKIFNYKKEIAATNLELKYLKEIQTPVVEITPATTVEKTFSVLPDLSETPLDSDWVKAHKISMEYDNGEGKGTVKFRVTKNGPSVRKPDDFYWVLLFHSTNGVKSFPPVLRSQSGGLVDYTKGTKISHVKRRKKVAYNFSLGSFIQSEGLDPVFGTLLLYDTKGNLLLKQRHELLMKYSEAKD